MTPVRFVVDGSAGISPSPIPTVRLETDRWDDFGFRTMFDVTLLLPGAEPLELGAVKIMKTGQESGYTELPGARFQQLGAAYCSLGQDIEYYEKLRVIPDDIRDGYLSSIRDAAVDPEIEELFQNEDAWQTSLLRFGAAEHALRAGRELLQSGQRTRSTGKASFVYRRSPLEVPFGFDATGSLPGRCNVVIGYNGVGKTHLLAGIARAASKVDEYDPFNDGSRVEEIAGETSTFGAVVAISYSAFDDFELPSRHLLADVDAARARDPSVTTFFGYTYCGLRRIQDSPVEIDPLSDFADWDGPAEDRSDELKSRGELNAEFLGALRRASASHVLEGDDALLGALEILEQEPSFGRVGVSPTSWVEDPRTASADLSSMSTGHKIVANIVVQLADNLRQRSLVLIDEPETHLHPPLLAALLRAIHHLLDHYDSFAVIATHSPVVLQEIPSEYVHVLQRYGDEVNLSRPQIETFGENVGAITRHVFNLDSSSTDYQGILRNLADVMTVDDVENLFPNGLSSQARALLLRAKREGA